MTVRVSKAHAYGNDFLFAPLADAGSDTRALARTMCDRHNGIGADGLILCELRDHGATMRLFNADGSPSELSGNGLRCLAAIVARAQSLSLGATVVVDTDAGSKALDLIGQDGQRYVIVGHSEVLDAWNQAKDQDIDHNNGS